jgi:hypothetical protein
MSIGDDNIVDARYRLFGDAVGHRLRRLEIDR